MQRFSMLAICLFLLACLTAGIAWASSAHFQSKNTVVTFNNDNSITVSWKEAGLDTLNIPYTLSAHIAADWVCVNNGGGTPNAANKATFSSNATSSGTFEAKNGNIIASLTLGPPTPPTSLQPTCGGGQHFALDNITYSTTTAAGGTADNLCSVTSGGVALCDSTHLVFLSLGNFSRTNLVP